MEQAGDYIPIGFWLNFFHLGAARNFLPWNFTYFHTFSNEKNRLCT